MGGGEKDLVVVPCDWPIIPFYPTRIRGLFLADNPNWGGILFIHPNIYIYIYVMKNVGFLFQFSISFLFWLNIYDIYCPSNI